jgi:2,3-bisphosphoglycerate-dependent phosphoglycerate mutase
MRLFVIARHGQSLLNIERRINGDPSEDVPLSELGEEEARLLGGQIVNFPLGLCIHTRFPRTRQTAEIALAGRDMPFACEPLLDDIDVGELDLRSVDEYRAWKRAHVRADRFPGGESLDDAARRYAGGFERLLDRDERVVLLIAHEIPVRYAVNAATGSHELDGPIHDVANATPYVFDEPGLRRAVDGIRRLA